MRFAWPAQMIGGWGFSTFWRIICIPFIRQIECHSDSLVLERNPYRGWFGLNTETEDNRALTYTVMCTWWPENLSRNRLYHDICQIESDDPVSHDRSQWVVCSVFQILEDEDIDTLCYPVGFSRCTNWYSLSCMVPDAMNCSWQTLKIDLDDAGCWKTLWAPMKPVEHQQSIRALGSTAIAWRRLGNLWPTQCILNDLNWCAIQISAIEYSAHADDVLNNLQGVSSLSATDCAYSAIRAHERFTMSKFEVLSLSLTSQS